MKRLLVTLIAVLYLGGTASAQHLLPPVPSTPSMQKFEAPVGVKLKHVPNNVTSDTLWTTPLFTDEPTGYEQALEAYKNATRQRPVLPPGAPADCSMIIWADTTTAVPMPTLTPNPNVDLTTPILIPDMGCAPPLSVQGLPDSLRTRPVLPKKYPMKFPRN